MRKTKYGLLKVFLMLVLLSSLALILYQNNHSVTIEVLAWQVDISLTFLMFGVALLGAIITFVSVISIGRR